MKRSATRSAVVIAAGVLFACSSNGGSEGGGSGDASSGGSGSSSGTSSSSGGSGSSSGMSSGTGDSGSSSGPATAGVSLVVNSASSPATVGGGPPSGNGFFVVVDLTLKNTGATVPLSANFVLFSLQTQQALVVSPAAQQPPGQCNPMVSLAVGGQIECQVAFDVPAGQTPTTLLYDDQRGDRASATVPAVPMSSACETFQGWTTSGRASSACATCITGTFTAACLSETEAYQNSCSDDSGACSACATSATLCSCERSCDSPSCQSLFAAQVSCLVSVCGASCP